jgi:choline dehydrogenase-like flavoprotein
VLWIVLPAGPAQPLAIRIAEERYARGEISTEELRRIPDGETVTEVVVERDGEQETYSADIVAISCGAANSAKLLLASATDKHPNGLANGSDQVGRNYMFHNSQAVLALSKEPNPNHRVSGLASSLLRLPLSGLHQRNRVQSDGRHAARAVGQERHGPTSADLPRHPWSGSRASSEHLRVADDQSPPTSPRQDLAPDRRRCFPCKADSRFSSKAALFS